MTNDDQARIFESEGMERAENHDAREVAIKERRSLVRRQNWGTPRQSLSTCLIKYTRIPAIICGAQNRAFRIRYGGLETAAPWQLARIVVAGTSAWKSGKAEIQKFR